MPPVAFDRSLFCLRDDARLTPTSCPDPPHLDAVSHHPYGIQGPLWHALNPDDAAVPDVYKIARVLHAAERAGHVRAGWTKAAVGHGDLLGQLARPTRTGFPSPSRRAGSSRRCTCSGARASTPFSGCRSSTRRRSRATATTYQAGLYYLGGAPKPAAQAFRFPFVTRRLNRGTDRRRGVALRAPASSRSRCDDGGRWAVVRRLRAQSDQVFKRVLPIRGRAVLRAQADPDTSLAWTQGG